MAWWAICSKSCPRSRRDQKDESVDAKPWTAASARGGELRHFRGVDWVREAHVSRCGGFGDGRAVMFAALDRAMATQFPNASGKVTGDQTTQLRLEALRALIDDEILMQRAEKDGLLASDAEVDARFNEIKAPYTQEDFQKHLQQLRMGIPDLKAQIRRQLSVEKLFAKEIGSHITISDAEVTAFYTANRANFNLAENKIRLAQIMVTPGPDPNASNLKNSKAQSDQEAHNKIQMIEMRVRQGEDFGALAQSYSEDQWAANGGDIGFVPESTLDRANPELRKLVLA